MVSIFEEQFLKDCGVRIGLQLGDCMAWNSDQYSLDDVFKVRLYANSTLKWQSLFCHLNPRIRVAMFSWSGIGFQVL